MSAKSKIEWTDGTWNPIVGCTRTSPGCQNCYAERFLARFGRVNGHKFEGLSRFTPDGPRWNNRVRLVADELEAPMRWRIPRRVFVCSVSDLFHEDVPEVWIREVFAAMMACPQHTFQVLTKRAVRMAHVLGSAGWWSGHDSWSQRGRNIWLGASVEDRERLPRIDDLRDTPAAVRFLSLEPLLEDLGALDLRGIHWVIAGGESGPGARPCSIAWIRSIVEQCQAAGVACFVKQVGRKPFDWASIGDAGVGIKRTQDPKGGDPDEWPADLRVREFPNPVAMAEADTA